MGLLRTWRCRRREKDNLRAALAASTDELAVTVEELTQRRERQAAMLVEFERAKESARRRNEIMRSQDTELRALHAQAKELRATAADLGKRLYLLAVPEGTPCTKLAWHSEGEARVFGEWLEKATGCGQMMPYPCTLCRAHVVTGQPVWHSTHVEEVRRGVANATRTTLSNRLAPAVLRSLRERFAAESDTWVQEQQPPN